MLATFPVPAKRTQIEQSAQGWCVVQQWQPAERLASRRLPREFQSRSIRVVEDRYELGGCRHWWARWLAECNVWWWVLGVAEAVHLSGGGDVSSFPSRKNSRAPVVSAFVLHRSPVDLWSLQRLHCSGKSTAIELPILRRHQLATTG